MRTITKGSGTVLFSGGTSQTVTDNNSTKQDLGNIQVSAGSTSFTPTIIASSGTISDATKSSAQPKLIYDGTNWWSFYMKSGTANTLFYSYSSNLTSWTESSVALGGTVTNNGNTTTVYYDSGTQTVLVSYYSNTTDHRYLRGNISGTTITWSANTLYYDTNAKGGSADYSSSFAIDSNNKVWGFSDDAGSNTIFESTNVISTSFADTAGNWTGTTGSSNGNWMQKTVILRLAGGNMLELAEDQPASNYQVQWSTYNGSTWSAWSTTGLEPAGAGVSSANWGVKRVDDTHTYFVGQSAASTLLFSVFGGASWDTTKAQPTWPTSGLATNSQVAVTSDGTNIYACVIRGDANSTVSCDKYTVASNTWGGWVDLTSTSATRAYISPAFNSNGTTVPVLWTQTNGANYNIYVDCPSTSGGAASTLNLGSSLKATAATIDASQTLTPGSNTLTLTGTGSPLTVNGTLTSSAGTVSFTATSGTITVPGTTYNNLDFSPASGSPTFQTASGGSWYSTGGTWNYRKAITIDHTKVAYNVGETYANFPVLIKLTDTNLETGALSSGNDILFTLSDGVTKLNHEIENYNSSTGELEAWVNVGASGLSSTVDTTLYMYYGNASAGNQQNVNGTWNSAYQGVWHLGDAGGGTSKDSTSYGNNGTNNYLTAGSGQIDGDGSFNGSGGGNGSNIAIGGSKTYATTSSSFSVSSWFNATNYTNSVPVVAELKTSGTGGLFFTVTNYSGSYTGVDIGSNDASWSNIKTGSLPSTGVWHHVVATYNGAGGTTLSNYKIYVDGTSQTLSAAGGYGDSNNASMVGAAGDLSSGEFWTGGLDESEITNNVLSADWVATEYTNQESASFYSVSSQQTSSSGGSASVSIANNLTVNAGTFTSAGNVTVSGGSATGNGTVNMTGGTFTLNGTGNLGNSSTTWIFNNLTIGGTTTATNASLKITGTMKYGMLTSTGDTIALAPSELHQILMDQMVLPLIILQCTSGLMAQVRTITLKMATPM